MTKHPILPEEAFKAPGALIGTTGAGKTVTMKKIVENIADRDVKLPVSILDPMGVSWGLKLSADGMKKGLDFALAGVPHDRLRKPQPDIPITPDSGRQLARVVVQNRISIVVDVSGFEDDPDMDARGAMTAEDKQVKFGADYTAAFYQANELPFYFFIDEAHMYAPQTITSKWDKYSKKMMERMAKQGRSQGIRPIFITQRPTSLSKDVLLLTHWKIIMRTDDREIEAVAPYIPKWVSPTARKSAMSNIPTLAKGEGYFIFGSEKIMERKRYPMIDTYDSSRTPDENDIDQVIATDLATMDLGALAEAFLPKSEEEEAEEAGMVTLEKHSQALREAREEAKQRGIDIGMEIGVKRGEGQGEAKIRATLQAVLDGKHLVELKKL